MKSIVNKAGVKTGIATAVLVAALLRVYLYWMGATYIPVTTDEALTVLQALDIRAGEFPLLLTAQPYMFPLEAYWMAPMVNVLPRTAFGMRFLVLLEGLVFVALSLLVLRRMGPWKDMWPGALLILFPSVYLVMNQSAYSLPHNNSAYILFLAAAWFVLTLNRPPAKGDLVLATAGGFFAVLAFSNAMLSLALIAPLLVLTVWQSIGRGRWIRLIGYGVGGILGISPYVLAIKTIPGAHQAVTATHAIGDALERFWSPTIKVTLPVTFGWRPTLFPDQHQRLDWGEWGYFLFPYVFTALIAIAVLFSAYRLVMNWRNGRRHDLGGLEMAIGASVLCCLLFMLSKRADSGAYRYLLPVVVVFPFIVSGIFAHLSSRMRSVVAAGCILLAAYNGVTALRLPAEWKNPDFPVDVVSAPDLKPALEFLRSHGIRHCVASHWAAYRIAFEGAGDIVCSQPYNERFGGWPIPYKTEVDASTNVAYVLTDKIRFLKPKVFEKHLRSMNVTAQVHTAGHFKIYHSFLSPAYDSAHRISPDRIQIAAAENAADLPHMLDGRKDTYWRSTQLQHTNLWVQFDLDPPVASPHIVLKYGEFEHDRAPVIHIRLLTPDGWQTMIENYRPGMDKFAWVNGKPTYDHPQQTFYLGDATVKSIRIEMAEPNPDWCWTIADVEIYRAAK